MQTLKGEHIYLRALEPEDLSLIYYIENNENNWEVSQTQAPFSKYVIKQYLENAHKDIYEVKQLRLVICSLNNDPLGLIDLFDFDPKNNKIGVGILILEKARNQKVAFETLQLTLKYVFQHLKVHQVYANILEDNVASIKLFKKLNFQMSAVKKDWIFEDNHYKNELLFQYINYVH